MSYIKEKYRRFRQWQQQPFDYRDTSDRHVCSNCGREAENNYCPRCGQKAVYGPITWSSVWRGLLDVWGVGTRSLPYSLWQLLWRPGYLMRDYISGKRQASFPPVKMLVVVALVLVMANTLFGVDYGNEPTSGATAGSDAFNAMMDAFFDWMTNHIAWTALIVFSLFIVPVWFLFRQAPRLPRHTLPQGFYIQVFIGVQFLTLMLLMVLLFELVPSLSGDGNEATSVMVTLVMPVMLLIDYRQLFGYGWWGTIWRVLVAFPLMLAFGKALLNFSGFVYFLCVQDWHNMTAYLMSALGMAAFLWLSLEIVHLINNRLWRDGISVKMFWRPLLALVAWILVIVISIRLGYKTPFDIFRNVLGALFGN